MNTDTQPINAASGWFKSTFSNPSQNCVEVRFGADVVYIRDSKDCGIGPVLSVPANHWARLLDEVVGRAQVGSSAVIQIVVDVDGGASLRAGSDTDKTLSYTSGEWAAFIAGVRNAEFDLPGADVAA